MIEGVRRDSLESDDHDDPGHHVGRDRHGAALRDCSRLG